ncbi:MULTISPECIES: class I SAM-dependent methyltransferase [Methylosinus]|uniref:Class I SAM-dependent methyltransferase n=1 Tax=Methylosinus trichosporium (strain ATCC 35070 / NCIMB 11131 / UNIQEM 75 / OB3b) TaxID=595536 RepID=A0A2D2D392_METT3|nr:MULTISPECIES: class I SAM-dependent methyltransferase [Methylosinus]ATQ69472.1 class I SAM-dependent methyltransferase [Methylosinus trichosporium OB3b]OBS52981.1 hypothetical protein A8B73_08900 [Methylosinus sp. 3S-1]
MLEKIGLPNYQTISKADPIVLRCIAELRDRLADKNEFVFYEIGVGIGATTQAVAKLMDNLGQIYLFSRDKDVQELTRDLAGLGYTNVNSDWGSPPGVFAGYHFQLAMGFVEKKLPMFDLVYVDGGHIFHLDAPAACILKELCKPGGYMLFDDWGWSMAKSPSRNPDVRPQTLKEYDPQQIKVAHVKLVCNAIMDPDTRFQFHGLESGTAIYQRKA